MSSTHIKMAFQSVKRDMMELKSAVLSVAERLEKLEASFEDSMKAPKKTVKKVKRSRK